MCVLNFVRQFHVSYSLEYVSRGYILRSEISGLKDTNMLHFPRVGLCCSPSAFLHVIPPCRAQVRFQISPVTSSLRYWSVPQFVGAEWRLAAVSFVYLRSLMRLNTFSMLSPAIFSFCNFPFQIFCPFLYQIIFFLSC